jgi:hypothetical protein
MAKTLIFTKEGGRVDLGRLDALVSTLSNGEYVLTITKRRERRTLSQNALLWMWLRCIAEDTGNTTDDLYDVFCSKFLRKRVEVNGDVVECCKTSSQLNTAEMTAFLDNIQVYAASELGITLPNPEDRNFEVFFQQYK